MCGIVGILDHRLRADGSSPIGGMLAPVRHRGPDGLGQTEREGCHLGFARLAIIDVAASAQPFENEDGSVLMVCNGQIYNSPELRCDLESRGHRFTTNIDTEVVVHLWEEHGPDLVHRLNGMFAFAVWDERRGTLVLGRDRVGEKPLFYWFDGTTLLFASELRSLCAHPKVALAIDPLALVRYLGHGFFPAPQSPIHGIRKLPAGHRLIASGGRIEVERYWSLGDWFPEPGAREARGVDELVDELDERLATAVRRRSRSDVPFGVFLSGGIDSSAVLAYVADQQGEGVPAFSIGHTDESFDESEFAAETARFFGARFERLVLAESDLEEGLRLVGDGLDEPLGDASTIPTHLLARFARQRVKVVLSGEGADELFGGYPTYLGQGLAEVLRRLPGPVRRGLVSTAARLAPRSMGNVGIDYLLERFAGGLEKEAIERHHTWFGCVHPGQIEGLLSPGVRAGLSAATFEHPFLIEPPPRELPDTLSRLLYTDFTMYLQDDLLTKVDRASMLASLEARAPFLDHELAQFVAGIPSSWKVRRLTTKAILRRTVRPRLPVAVLDRRKRGFNIPFSRWILHGFGAQLRQRFARERVEARGVFSFDAIDGLLEDHLARRADNRKPLFTLLAFDLWCDRTFGDGAAVPIADPEDDHSEVST